MFQTFLKIKKNPADNKLIQTNKQIPGKTYIHLKIVPQK